MKALKAIVWKEWRENVKSALLAMLGLGAMTYYLQYQAAADYIVGIRWLNQLLIATSCGAPVAALLLGVLQIFPELRRDQWAFLVHRPIPRSTIYYGKVIAGLSLYFLATALPFFCAQLWIAMPGHYPIPYDIRMSLPVVADVVSSIPFYFAGLLFALRPARWYGSRIFPLIGAGVGHFAALSQGEFWPALACGVLATGLMFLAARGSFLTDGNYEAQPKASRFSLAAVVIPGVVVVTVGAISLVLGIVATATAHRGTYRWMAYQIDREGRVLIATYEDGPLIKLTDLHGNPVPKVNLNSAMESAFLPGTSLYDRTKFHNDPGYRSLSRFFLILGNDGSLPQQTWYYVLRNRRGEGYSVKTGKLQGVFGPAGFSPRADNGGRRFNDELRNDWQEYYQSDGLLRFQQSVYRLDIRSHKIFSLLTVAKPETIIDAGYLRSLTLQRTGGPEPSASVIVIATSQKLYIVSAAGRLLLSVPVDRSNFIDGSLTVCMTPRHDRFFLWHNPSWPRTEWNHRPVATVAEISAQGAVLRQLSLPSLDERERPDEGLPYLFSPVFPPTVMAGGTVYAYLRTQLTHDDSMRQLGQGFYPANWWAMCLICALVNLILIAPVYLIARRCAWNKQATWRWALGVYLLGWPGLLMLLALRGWPMRVACPNCGRKRVVTREYCEHCGAAFPPPAHDGTEIIEALPATG
jgi:hypothetical protein